MTVPSIIIKDDGSVDWQTFLRMQERGGRVYQNALNQLEDAGILSKSKEGNHQVNGMEGYYFTRTSDAKDYSGILKNGVNMLLTCRT
jgi:hypothetical protein